MPFKVIEARGPHPPVRRQPLIDRAERLRADAVKAALGIAPNLDQPRLPQNPQVLGDRGLAQLKLVNEIADRSLADSQ